MNRKWTVIAVTALVAAVALTAGDPASAASRAKTKKAKVTACVDRPHQFSWDFLLSTQAPQPNGCAPPVYSGGRYIGQDPDPYIRMQLMRDPATGYPNNY